MITITIEGPDKSGKGHAVALIAKYLRDLGCDVTVQAEETHTAPKMEKDESDLLARLRDARIVVREMRTST